MEQLDLMRLRERIDRSLPESVLIVVETSGICEWTGKYLSCRRGCDGTDEELRCSAYLGRNYSE